jgi:glycosyltransferase involved in cell wall biosynthesis
MYDDIFDTVRRLRLEENVHFVGHVPENDLPAIIKGADLLVYPSLYEGFGLPPLEAMACGTPVVASNTSSLPEVVGDAGVLVEPEDVASIAAGIALVLNDAKLRTQLSARGLIRAQEFTWERAAWATLEVYSQVLQEARS